MVVLESRGAIDSPLKERAVFPLLAHGTVDHSVSHSGIGPHTSVCVAEDGRSWRWMKRGRKNKTGYPIALIKQASVSVEENNLIAETVLANWS